LKFNLRRYNAVQSSLPTVLRDALSSIRSDTMSKQSGDALSSIRSDTPQHSEVSDRPLSEEPAYAPAPGARPTARRSEAVVDDRPTDRLGAARRSEAVVDDRPTDRLGALQVVGRKGSFAVDEVQAAALAVGP